MGNNTNSNGPDQNQSQSPKVNIQPPVKKKEPVPVKASSEQPRKEPVRNNAAAHIEEDGTRIQKEPVPKKKVVHVDTKDVSEKRKYYNDEIREASGTKKPQPQRRPQPRRDDYSEPYPQRRSYSQGSHPRNCDYEDEYYDPRYYERPPRRHDYYEDDMNDYDDYYDDRPRGIKNNTKIVVIIAIAVAVVAIAVAVMCVIGRNNTPSNEIQTIQAKSVSETETATTVKGTECEASEDGYHHYTDSEMKIFYKAEYMYFCPECNSYISQEEKQYHKTLEENVAYQTTDHYYDEHIVSIGTRYDGDYTRTEPITVQTCEYCHAQKESEKECAESPNGYHDYYTVFNYYATNEKSGTISELMSIGSYTEAELVNSKTSFEIKKRSAIKKCIYCEETKIFETNDFGDIKEKNIQSPFAGRSEYDTATTTAVTRVTQPETTTTQPTTTQPETTTTARVPETTTTQPETTTTYREPETTAYVEPETTTPYVEPETEPETETTVHVHSYSSYEALPATCTSSGVMIYSCSCGDSYSETIPQLQHNWVTSYSYDEEGNIVETIQCSICGSIR